MSSEKKKTAKILTTLEGTEIVDDNNSLTAGRDGPILLQDVEQIEKLSSFDRERISERVVHAKGAGAHGYFTLLNDMSEYTCAKLFTKTSDKTPVFVRFSTVIGSKGLADTARDPRGFAVKFYTDKGVYDIVGNNLPVFFIRDSIKFPDLIHSLKPSPDTNLTDPERFWDFVTKTPEAIHMVTWLYSDRGTVKSFRKMEGFGVNTYVWVNGKGDRCFIKYHWKPKAGIETITRQEAEILAGLDPDIAVRDLYQTLNSGKTVEYTLYVQIMKMCEAYDLSFDPLDATKTWPEDKFALKKVGVMILTDAPSNFFAEVEQAAFCPANLIEGVEPSADKLLQGRLFSYKDTQRYRLGTNFMELPINRPKNDVVTNTQDGHIKHFANSSKFNYFPSTLNQSNRAEGKSKFKTHQKAEGNIIRKKISKTEDFTQAGERYRSLSEKDKKHLIDNIINELWNVDKKIQNIIVEFCKKSDLDFGTKVKKILDKK